MARMTNFRSAAIATGNTINDSAYDNVKIVSDNIDSINTVGSLVTEDNVDFALLAQVLNNLGAATSEHLASLAGLDLSELIEDLAKGNYLGNRKIDINLALNVQGITPELIKNDPQAAQDLWVANSANIPYSRATITFVDGDIVELPFLSDNNPTVVTNSDGLLVQLNRTDVVDAAAQENVIYSFDVLDNTSYAVEIDNIDYTYTTGVGATRGEIVTGLTNQINSGNEPWTAYNEINTIRVKADIAGNGFIIHVSTNMLIRLDVANVTAGNYPTAFLNKLEDTAYNSFTLDSVSNTIRLFDIIGTNSNIERMQLHTSPSASGYIESSPVYYWAKTTSALEVLSMRAGDIIKLGNEIDKIVLLANSIEQVLEIQDRIPELVDRYVDGVPKGDITIYNKLTELDAIYQALTGLITIYNDIKVDGTNYINSVGANISDVTAVAQDINLGVDSKIVLTGSNIDDIIAVAANEANIDTVAADIANVNSVATVIVPNIAEILLADDNAVIATNKALEATTAATIATAKNNEIKNVSVGSTITAVPSTPANVTYNPADGKFTFIVPQGIKGDRGEAFQVNAVGLFVDRGIYDTQLRGFSFLAIDQATIYFKLSNTSGDWTVGAPFGKGEKGEKGDTGVGIASVVRTTGDGSKGSLDEYTITYTDSTEDVFSVYNGDDGVGISTIAFTSTTDASGLKAKSGATDTYTITYTDTTTTTFDVHNGLDSDVYMSDLTALSQEVTAQLSTKQDAGINPVVASIIFGG